MSNGRSSYAIVGPSANLAEVKPPNEPATKSDPALVIAVSPNSASELNPLITKDPIYNQTVFGQSRVATPLTLFDHINKYELDARELDTSVATGGTVVHQPLHASVRLTVTGSNGSQAKLRTKTYFRYQAGKSQTVLLSVIHADIGQNNQTRRWGYFDDSDGLFFALVGTTLQVVRRTSVSGSVVDNSINQSSWNVDKLDGTGTSGVTLDITKGSIYEIHFQWLGVGVVRYFVNGILVHEILNQNSLSSAYMKTAQLPLSWEVINTGASTSSFMDSVCSSISSDGGNYPSTLSFSAANTADIVVTTTQRPVLSIRPKATYNSIENRMLLLPILASIRTEGARIGWRIVMNGTLTGFSFNSVDVSSSAEFDIASTAISGGEQLYLGFLPNSNDREVLDVSNMFDILLRKLRRAAFSSNVDVLTITAVNEASGSTNVRASLTWKEVR